LLAWKSASVTAPGSPVLPTVESPLRLLAGQTSVTDANNPLFNSDVRTIQAGNPIAEKLLSVGDTAYTRAQLLMMRRTAGEYTYSSSGAEKTDKVRGVALADLLGGVPDSATVDFSAADGYSVSVNGMTKGELENKNAVLAYETQTGGKWQGIFTTAKNDSSIKGYLTLYIDGATPVKKINNITVSGLQKETQDPPAGLSGAKPSSDSGKGRIVGTTAGMEYSDNQANWIACANDYTEVPPGQYYVRYAETDTHYASVAIMVSVAQYQASAPPPVAGDTVLSVYNGSVKVKDFTQSDIDGISKTTNNYSTINTWPTYSDYIGVTGVRIADILSAAKLNPSGSNQITFYSSDGYYSTLKVSDLTATRYYFNSAGSKGAAVPAVISFDADGGRLYLGQLTAQEQTQPAFVGMVDRIVIGGAAGSWGVPTASPASGGTVSEGADIRLALPADSGDAKIYYTLDGTAPTMESAMYNITGDRWIGRPGVSENPPIKAPSDSPFTITARIIGIGKNDGNTVKFNYNGATSGSSSRVGSSVVIEVDAVPLGDMPVITFTTDDLSDKIKEAAADSSGALELKISAADTAASIQVEMEAASVKEMIDANLKYLTVNSPLGYNAYDLAALKSIYSQGSGKVTFIIKKVDIEGLSGAMKAAAEGKDVYEMIVMQGGKQIDDFGSGAVITRLPYNLETGQSAYGVKAWRLGDDAKVTELESAYNSVLGYVQFTRSGNSYYIVGYDANAAEWADNPFADVKPGNWFFDSVRFVYERELMTGTSAAMFSPDMALTRGMLVTILHRLAGSPGVSGIDNSFDDVADGAWYADAVLWASDNGIVSGYGGGKFGPNDAITREQAAAILYRYANFVGIDISADVSLSAFSDAGSVSAYAARPMQWAAAAGIIQGSDNKLDPKGNATRAQVAAILERFITNNL